VSRTIRPSIARGYATAAVAALFLIPIVAMIVGSFRAPGLPPPRGIELIPPGATLEAYRSAFSLVPLGRAVLNSLVVAAVFVPLAIATASLAGYAIAQATPRVRRAAVAGLLILLMIPVSALWLTRFAMFKQMGLTDTYVPLVAPALMGGSPLFVLLYLLAFRRLPQDLFDAARIEGATEWAIWRRVAMPIVRGTTVAVGLLAFAVSWGNFLDPLLYLNTESRYTAPLVLRSLQQLDQTNWPVMLAGSVVVAAPVVVAFAAALRLIVPRKGAGWLGV
jgi:multiple sugar transport system permease protein